jgi:hypothetical protein
VPSALRLPAQFVAAMAIALCALAPAAVDGAGVVKPRATGPAFLQKYLKDEIDKWGDILRTTKDTD